MNLYEINEQYQDILAAAMAAAEDNEGVIPDDLAAKLDAVEISRDLKLENCVKYYKNELAMAEVVAAEYKAFQVRMKRHDRAAEWMKNHIAVVLKPGERREYGCGALSWRRSQSVDIQVPIEQLPQEYTKYEITARKAEIKEALKSGEAVNGCVLLDKINLQIQ
jgi:hypothetical protein